MHTKPYIIAVAGGSGSGKTTVVNNLIDIAQKKEVLVIRHDDYYKDQSHLKMDQRAIINYDHPNSLETSLLITHLEQLILGKTVHQPLYNFVEHTRAKKTKRLTHTKVVIVEGILLYENQKLRNLFDLKIFVDTDSDVCLMRRLRRDIAERGRAYEEVLKQYERTVRPMYIEFVEPSKRYADLIIPEGGENKVALNLLLLKIERELV